MARSHQVVVSGVGLISACGTTQAAHLAALDAPPNAPDPVPFAPHAVYRAAPFDAAWAIPSKSDRRQMEPWQVLGVTAARMALDSAGLTETDALGELYLNICANGGARETDIDFEVLNTLRSAPDPEADLVVALARRLRPSFLLGQLSNILAGNIAIILGVGGGARTFMGDEMAGVDAVADAVARVAAGQSDRIMVGSVLDAERADLILALALGGRLATGATPSVFDPSRQGMVPGSVAAFLVIEAAEAAQARGARALAQLGQVATAANAGALQDLSSDESGNAPDLVFAGVSGVQPETTLALAALRDGNPAAQVLASSDLAGHAIEAQFPFDVALAALAIDVGRATRVLTTTACDSGAAAIHVGQAT